MYMFIFVIIINQKESIILCLKPFLGNLAKINALKCLNYCYGQNTAYYCSKVAIFKIDKKKITVIITRRKERQVIAHELIK